MSTELIDLGNRVRQLELQQQLMTEALLRVVEGKWTGAEGAAGVLVALTGGVAPAGFAPVAFARGPTQVRVRDLPGLAVGRFATTPRGIILHGSRSGIAGRSTADEFESTSEYARGNVDGYCWNATIGDDEYTLHLPHNWWGWNARAASSLYMAVEFAQATVTDNVTPGQIRAFAQFVHDARHTWPKLGTEYPTHAELDGMAVYGGYHDGKSDVYPAGDPRADELRAAIVAAIDN